MAKKNPRKRPVVESSNDSNGSTAGQRQCGPEPNGQPGQRGNICQSWGGNGRNRRQEQKEKQRKKEKGFEQIVLTILIDL